MRNLVKGLLITRHEHISELFLAFDPQKTIIFHPRYQNPIAKLSINDCFWGSPRFFFSVSSTKPDILKKIGGSLKFGFGYVEINLTFRKASESASNFCERYNAHYSCNSTDGPQKENVRIELKIKAPM